MGASDHYSGSLTSVHIRTIWGTYLIQISTPTPGFRLRPIPVGQEILTHVPWGPNTGGSTGHSENPLTYGAAVEEKNRPGQGFS